MAVLADGLLDELDAKYLSPNGACTDTSVVVGASAVTLSTMRGVFAFVAIMLLAALSLATLEIAIYRFRFVNTPFKLCRRLNICCGYHYVKPPRPPLPRGQWNPARSLTTLQSLVEAVRGGSSRALHVTTNPLSALAPGPDAEIACGPPARVETGVAQLSSELEITAAGSGASNATLPDRETQAVRTTGTGRRKAHLVPVRTASPAMNVNEAV